MTTGPPKSRLVILWGGLPSSPIDRLRIGDLATAMRGSKRYEARGADGDHPVNFDFATEYGAHIASQIMEAGAESIAIILVNMASVAHATSARLRLEKLFPDLSKSLWIVFSSLPVLERFERDLAKKGFAHRSDGALAKGPTVWWPRDNDHEQYLLVSRDFELPVVRVLLVALEAGVQFSMIHAPMGSLAPSSPRKRMRDDEGRGGWLSAGLCLEPSESPVTAIPPPPPPPRGEFPTLPEEGIAAAVAVAQNFPPPLVPHDLEKAIGGSPAQSGSRLAAVRPGGRKDSC